MLFPTVFASLGAGPCLIGPIGMGELLIILFLVLLFFGPKRLPEMAEALGRSIRKFKEASREVKSGIESSTEKKPEITEGKDKQG
jgi:sec-independent protein translocase protein TatA